MKLFKVWANNCVRPKGQRIIEAYESDLNEAMDRVYEDALEHGLVDDWDEDGNLDNEKLEAAYAKIRAYWEKNKSLEAGDWMIVEAESISDITVPNMCAGDAGIIF